MNLPFRPARLARIAGLLPVALALAAFVAPSAPPPPAPAVAHLPPAPPVPLLRQEMRRVCQLVGEVERATGQPTLNRTESRFGFWGTDLGASFTHKDRTVFLFGDTHVRPGLARPKDVDFIASTADKDPEDCLSLDVPTAPDGGFQPFVLPDTYQGAFGVPTGGFSLNGRMHVFASAEYAPATSWPAACWPPRTMTATASPSGSSCRVSASSTWPPRWWSGGTCPGCRRGRGRRCCCGQRPLPGQRPVPGRAARRPGRRQGGPALLRRAGPGRCPALERA
ncbi:DUF4185 domain-containing protein [Aerophototrophica crusticola]|uniref:DUF4185 domain-containing protein n=1 Tax=Aerophototrophica crusticola TaxID=1709002 RepID=A0A858R447_9PROT|nr:DUF4185 domain-containing protein [Rhodospirillaceae bacterium B3]